MRRQDREITDIEQILDIVASCEVCRIGLNGEDGFPYILPMNYGFEYAEEKLSLYFHTAVKGYKHQLIAADNKAAFEMDIDHKLLFNSERGYCTMNYRSIMGKGRISYIEDESEKIRALTLITDRYHPEGHFEFSHAAIPRTSVFRLDVEQLTAKGKNSKA